MKRAAGYTKRIAKTRDQITSPGAQLPTLFHRPQMSHYCSSKNHFGFPLDLHPSESEIVDAVFQSEGKLRYFNAFEFFDHMGFHLDSFSEVHLLVDPKPCRRLLWQERTGLATTWSPYFICERPGINDPLSEVADITSISVG
jgi:hypothetical protein